MKTVVAAAAFVASVSAYNATSLPECWSACFAQYNLQDEECLCDDTTGKAISSCIASGCDSAEAGAYASWLTSYCAASSSSVPIAPASSFPVSSYPVSSVPASAVASGSWPASYPVSSASESASWAASYPVPSGSGSAAASWQAPSGSEPASYAAPTGSSPVAPITSTITTTICPCEQTHTPGEVYTTTVTESVTVIPHQKSYSWGEWTSQYTSYESSTCTGEFTVTKTHPGGAASGYPSGGASGYPSGGVSGFPSGGASGYPSGGASGYPSGGAGGNGGSYSFPSPTKTCKSASSATPSGGLSTAMPPGSGNSSSCKPCEGQGSGPYCGLTINDDVYAVAPKTCKTVTYDWTVTQGTISPDGVERFAFLINNQMPGPEIKADWGDTIVVKLTNGLPPSVLNGTTLHFHGIRQNGTNEYDGVPSLTQCPLAPGDTMTYTFQATSYGTSWWHAHYALQTYEGIFGPMTIEGPSALEYDDDQVIVLQDWNHAPVDTILDNSEVFVPGVQGGPITLDTGLINGMNVWEGAGEYYSMTVEKGKTYRLRVMNTAIQSTFKFHIDGHTFQVIAMDFVPIHPYTTEIVSINIGQRYDLIMTADQEPGNYWMRSDNQQPCGQLIQPNIQGILNYAGVDVADPTTTAIGYAPDCLDESSSNLVPIVEFTVGAQDGGEFVETSIIAPNGQNPNLYKWTLSGNTFMADWGNPTLYNIWEDGSFPKYGGDLTIDLPNLGEWVYFVIDSPMPLPHPIHLHGHEFFVLASGVGAYTGDVALTLDNPPRRDVAVMPADPTTGSGGYLVIAYQTSNPGVWLLHCHIGWHNTMGFALQIIEGLDKIEVEDSCQMLEVCQNWHSYANQYNVFNAPFDDGA